MGKSIKTLGDRWDMVRHDNERNPRKIKTNVFTVILLIAVFITSSYTFNQWMPDTNFFKYLPTIMLSLATVLSLLLYYLKWKKNDKEHDMLLLIFAILSAVFAYVFLPATVPVI